VKKGFFSKGYIFVIMAFLYAPILIMILFSFNATKARTSWDGFTLDWYKQLFSDTLIIQSVANTLLVAAVASLLATLIGTAAAIGISKMNKTAKGLILNLTYIPVINPEIVMGVSLMLLFVFLKTAFHLPLEFGYLTLILSHITFCVPYVILNVLPKLRQTDAFVYEAALDLGCTDLQAFFKVVMPEIMPGIIAGFLMAFTYSLDDFIISYFTTGPESQTLPITIFSMTRRRVSPKINAISAIIFIVVLLILLLVNLNDMRREKQKGAGNIGKNF
jgi:spermidine/putrescine transport system permease protein